ncbi:MAG: cupin domain-containing protein [Acidobacteriota bacterium]
MAIAHAASGDLIPAQPLGDRLHEVQSYALLKSTQLELIRLVLPQGKSMKDHQVSGEITIQCIEGIIELTIPGKTLTLKAGDLVFLAGHEPHGLQALEDASALLTISLTAR